MLAEEWVTSFGTKPATMQVQEVRSYHAMIACTAAGSCFTMLPRSVLDLAPNARDFTIKPLMTVDTWLVCRAGFATLAFSAFRDTLCDFADIKDAGDARS